MKNNPPVDEVLLLRPARREFVNPIRDFLRLSSRSYPLGLAYLAGALKRRRISVKIVDAWADVRMEKISPPRELSRLRWPQKLLGLEYHHMGMPDREVRALLRGTRFPVVGISSMFSGYHGDSLRMAALVKQESPNSLVVLGGAAVTASPEATLSDPNVDYIVSGEGEETFPRLVLRLLGREAGAGKDLPGVGTRQGGTVRLREPADFVADIDSLPRPNHQVLVDSLQRTPLKRRLVPYISLFTSRGCPHRCDFCTIYLTMGRRFRAHSPKRVVEEISRAHRSGVGVIHIEDDNFAFDQERAKAILRLVIKRFGPRHLVFRNYNGMTALSLRDPELADLMGRAGFDLVYIALESSDVGVRGIMMKPGTVRDFAAAVKQCVAAGIGVGAYTILGLPYSTLRKDIRTVFYALSQPVDALAAVPFYPIPMTPQHADCVTKGWIRPEARYLSRLRSSVFAAPRRGYTRREVFTLLALAALFTEYKRSPTQELLIRRVKTLLTDRILLDAAGVRAPASMRVVNMFLDELPRCLHEFPSLPATLKHDRGRWVEKREED